MKTPKSMSFTGTSQRGDLAEALGDAIQQALKSSHIVDGIVTWTIEKISGENGGIVGKNEISVTIAAKT
jgi:hypothetical protein